MGVVVLIMCIMAVCCFKYLFAHSQPASKSSTFSSLRNFCIDGLGSSAAQYESGSDYHSNPKPQMGTWIDPGIDDELFKRLDMLRMNKSSNFNAFMESSYDIPIVANAIRSDEFDLNIIHLPTECSLPTRLHASGTVLFYKVLSGEDEPLHGPPLRHFRHSATRSL